MVRHRRQNVYTFMWAFVVGLIVGFAQAHPTLLRITGSWLIVLTFATFVVFSLDKSRAQRRARRISESTLLYLVALGGTLGALLSMALIRHKTAKRAFLQPFWLIIGCQVLGLVLGSWGAQFLTLGK